MKKTYLWLLAGYVIGSYLGLNHLLALFGSKKG